jgi:poly(beta-D-mannuronate) lyase
VSIQRLQCLYALRVGVLLGGLMCASASATVASAATFTVNSISALQTRINAAVAGDVIILQNGVYTTSAAITITRTGTSSAPITIQAQTVGGVEIRGTNGFSVNSPASWIVIDGFLLTHASGHDSIASGATHIRFTRNTFQCTGDGSYLVIAGDDAQIDHNEFRNKSTLGEMIDARGSGSQMAQRIWIHHNYFHDFTNAGGNGAETIRFGLSGLSLSDGLGIIEYNLFVRCMGENELISNKSSSNTIRYNTLLDSPGTQLTVRHGNFCLVYGNYLRNTDGIRIFGDNHQIFSNYLEGNTIGINIGNGDGEVENGDALTSHDKPDNTVIAFNTMINNTTHYVMSGRTNGLGAANTTFSNNIMQGGGVVADINGPYTGAVWSGNITWNTGGAGDMPSSGFTNVNPLLATDANGVFHIQSGSPAINSAVGTFSAVTFDMDGQPRTSPKDKGADEFSTAPITAHLLTTADVGPNSGSSCVMASGGSFQNFAIANQTGTFTAEYDATPSASPINGYVALSQGAQTAHTGFAAIARFNPTGQIDARNGANYAADAVLNYSTGVSYHFRLVVNVATKTYSVFVTPQGGSELQIASGYAFRSEQSGVTSLNSWGTWAGTGSLTTCGFNVH